MGRHKTYKTKVQQEKAKQTHRATHNAKRKARYTFDWDYRSKVAVLSREGYRERHGVEMREPISDADVRKVAICRVVELGDGTTKKMLTLNNDEMAYCLGGYHKFVINRWQRTKRFPRGPYWAEQEVERVVNGKLVRGVVRCQVYPLDLALKLLRVMREHLSEKLYFTKHDTATIERLFEITETY